MSKCSTKGHISKAKIIRKAKSEFSTDEVKAGGRPTDKGLFSLELPHFVKVIGPKQKKILSLFVPSAITYGITALICICYLTEWKAVLQYLPFYRGKYFKPQESEKKQC